MKTFLLAGLLLISSLAYAERFQSSKAVVCDDLNTVITVLKEQMGEDPVWQGTDLLNGTGYIFFMNSEAKTWSFVQHNERIACVLGAGNDIPQEDKSI